MLAPQSTQPGSSARTPLRVLVIGAGPGAAGMHLPVLSSLRDDGALQLQIVCDLQQERASAAQQRFRFAAATGDAAAALTRPDIDAVYVFGSAQMHHEYGLAALLNGKHLFVEKPIAPSYRHALEMAQAAAAAKLVAVGGHNRRFYRGLAAARANAGNAGWRFAEAVFHKPELGKPPAFGAYSWLSANGIHALDALLYMMGGLPEHLTAFADEATPAAPNAFTAIMRWPDGAQGTFLCNNSAGARREEYAFHGSGATWRIDETGFALEKNNISTRTASQTIGDGIAAEHAAFLQAIHQGTEPAHAIAALAPSLFLCELIEKGFNGRIRLPQAPPARSVPHRRPATQSILVMQAASLQSELARLSGDFRLLTLQDVSESPSARDDVVAAILGRGAPPLTAATLDKLPRLSAIGVVGLSLARHAPDALLARGITLFNASETYAESVAEFALGLAILGRRRAFRSHDLMRAGGWGIGPQRSGLRRLARAARPLLRTIGLEEFLLELWKSARPLARPQEAQANEARELRGSTVALIGWSANARAFARMLAHAQARVLVYSEHATDEEIREAGCTPVSLREALGADVVSLHRGLTPKTRHFLSSPELAALRPGSVLINIARGALIEPGALYRRLSEGDVIACLDTYESEPPHADDPLRRLPNVFLTSHIAGGSKDMYAAAAGEVVRKVAAHLAGEEVRSISAGRLRTMT